MKAGSEVGEILIRYSDPDCSPNQIAAHTTWHSVFKKNGSRKLLDIEIHWLIAEDKYWEMLVPGPIWPLSDMKMWYKSWYKAEDKCLKIEFPRVELFKWQCSI